MSREIRITPSILNADFSRLNEEIDRIAGVSDLLHLDVMDDVFVPNFTFDFEAASKIIKESSLPVDAHLMVANVDQIAIDYAQAGSASVTFHAEAVRDIRATAKGIRSAGARAALALKPATSIHDYSDFLDSLDMFLIMTVEPGFGGQAFIEEMLSKIESTRRLIGDRPIWLQVDGGIDEGNIERIAAIGADTFVAGSAVFKAQNREAQINALRALAEKGHGHFH